MARRLDTPSNVTPLRAPRDGIHSSQRRRGWLAEAWLAILKDFDVSSRQRIARGRGLARGGRVRELWFSPGLANAEVVERDGHHVSLRVRVFDEGSWRRAVKLLRSRLDFVASLLEGELPQELVETFAAARLPLIPSAEEFDGDCDCGDYALPCAHMAAVHVLLADALDGDPFLLLTLRGRPREQVLAALRRSWGDEEPLVPPSTQDASPAPTGVDWYQSPQAIGAMDFRPLMEPGGAPTGLRELGPPPGGEDVERALGPLYQTGAEVAESIAMQEEATGQRRRSFLSATTEMAPRRALGPQAVLASGSLSFSMTVSPKDLEPADEEDLVEAILELLEDREGYRARDLAVHLGVDLSVVRRELRRLEQSDVVKRTGRTRGTRWWLV